MEEFPPVSEDVAQRKLVILGLPWETTEETFLSYFRQFGPLEDGMIMKDRYTNKSRGFGFVTYAHPADAQQVEKAEHHVDGRRCEAKFALPRGGSNPNRTTRIFVARIPPSVSEHQFRAYFEHFGTVQDAYMPKDASKQGHRGIGFVTFASAEPVELVTSQTHTLNGQELGIDRATPKEKGGPGPYPSGPSYSSQSAASSYNTAASRGGSASYGNSYGGGGGGSTASGGLGISLSNDSLSGISSGLHSPVVSHPHLGISNGRSGSSNALLSGQQQGFQGNGLAGRGMNGSGMPGSAGMLDSSALAQLTALDGFSSNGDLQSGLQALQGLPGFGGSRDGIGIGLGLQQLAMAQRSQAQAAASQSGGMALGPLGLADLNSSILRAALQASPTCGYDGVPVSESLLSPGPRPGTGMNGHVGNNRLSLDRSSVSPDRPGLASGFQESRSGPRIFVGKLNKETNEADVRDYFTRFGYVMDVYMPRDKMNRTEHRGFGFVTFETAAAVQRVASHGTHMIRGSVVAIDSAVPRRDDGAPGANGEGGGERSPGPHGNGSAHASSSLHMNGVSMGAAYPELAGLDLQDISVHGDVGPARHHTLDRRHGYKPY